MWFQQLNQLRLCISRVFIQFEQSFPERLFPLLKIFLGSKSLRVTGTYFSYTCRSKSSQGPVTELRHFVELLVRGVSKAKQTILHVKLVLDLVSLLLFDLRLKPLVELLGVVGRITFVMSGDANNH